METAENLCLDFGCRRKRAFLQRAHWEKNIPLESFKFHGPAANVLRFSHPLCENRCKNSNGVATTLFLANNNTDFVGGGVGANLTTAGTCLDLPSGKCYNHSSYNGWETIGKYLRDGQGQKYRIGKQESILLILNFLRLNKL